MTKYDLIERLRSIEEKADAAASKEMDVLKDQNGVNAFKVGYMRSVIKELADDLAVFELTESKEVFSC